MKKINDIFEQMSVVDTNMGKEEIDLAIKEKILLSKDWLANRENFRVATTFKPLGKETTAQLMFHGYLSAMINLYVLCGDFPLIKIPSLDEFKDMVGG